MYTGIVHITWRDYEVAQPRISKSLQRLREWKYVNAHVSWDICQNERAISRGALWEVLFEKVSGAIPTQTENSLWDCELYYQGEKLLIDVKTATISRWTDIHDIKTIMKWNMFIQERQLHDWITYVMVIVDEAKQVARIFWNPYIRGEVIRHYLTPSNHTPGNYQGYKEIINYKIPYTWFRDLKKK